MGTINVGRIDTSKWPAEFQGYDVGGNGYLYVSFNASAADPDWYEVSSVTDVSLTRTSDEIDATTRRSNRAKSSLPGQFTINYSTTIMVDMKDPVYKALEEAMLVGFIPRFGVFTSNGAGPVFDGTITDMTRTENMNETVKANLNVSNADLIAYYTSFDSSATSGVDSQHPMGNVTTVTSSTTITLGT